MNAAETESQRDKWDGWDKWICRIADFPWGVFALIMLFVLLRTDQVEHDDIAGLGAAAGLLGVGHGLHMAGKHRSRG